MSAPTTRPQAPKRTSTAWQAYAAGAHAGRFRRPTMTIVAKAAGERHPASPVPDDFLTHWIPEIHGSDPAALCRVAAGRPRRLGEMVIDLDPDHGPAVVHALAEAARQGRRAGEVLVDHGILTAPQRDTLLEFQRHQRGEAPTDDRLRLGRILVSQGHISEDELGRALAAQRGSGRPLGEELLAKGRITPDALHRALKTQRQLVIASLVAALAMASPGVMSPAAAAQSVSQSVRFVIKVPPVVRLQMTGQPLAFAVTAEDVSRGYVELPSAAVLQVKSNTAWGVHFAPRQDIIRGATVNGLAGEVRVGPEGASRANLLAARQGAAYELSYRFDLAPGVTPGTYPWPLAVSAQAV